MLLIAKPKIYMKKRFEIVFNNENGSTTVQTLIAITVSLSITVSIVVLGAVLLKYLAGTTGAVDTL